MFLIALQNAGFQTITEGVLTRDAKEKVGSIKTLLIRSFFKKKFARVVYKTRGYLFKKNLKFERIKVSVELGGEN